MSRKNLVVSQLEDLSLDAHPRSRLRTSNRAAPEPNQDPATRKSKKSRHKPAPVLEPLSPLTPAEHTNVSCRFVLKSESHFSPYTINVDQPIPAHLVWRIVSPARDCPICLDVAEVPRMMGCGHIMCIHCMIQHAQFSDAPNVCPICGSTVNTNPLKTTPVSFLHSDPAFLPKDGEEIILTLMKRPLSSALALPVDVENGRKFRKFPAPDFVQWTRVCQADVEYAKEELSKELRYLIGASKRSVKEFGSDEGYNDGIAAIKQHIKLLNSEPTEPAKKHSNHSTQNKTDDECVYFYQTAFESPTVYTLDALDVSILKSAYGSPENFPTALIVKVENIQHTIYDRLRDKRFKHLSHLPEQTSIAFMECDWTGVVEPAVLKKFAAKLKERRQHKRQMQAREHADSQRALASIERQFQQEVAEAMLPHAEVSLDDAPKLDTRQLPSLPSSQAANPPKQARKQWVDENKITEEFTEEIMKNAYVSKRGRKEMILRF